MKYCALVIAGALPLAACNKGPQVDEKNASVAEVAQKVRTANADQAFVRPGLWESGSRSRSRHSGMPPK